MSKNISPKPEGSPQTRIALIGATASIITAIVAGLFGLLQSNLPRPEPLAEQTPTIILATNTPLPTVLVTPTLATSSPATNLPTVEIEGAATAPLGKKSYFTIKSQGAVRAEWSVGGFADNKAFVVEPLAQSHQIYLEPTDASRIGDTFTLVVTVYNANGTAASAQQRFQVVASSD